MKLFCDFELMDMGDEFVAVPIGDKASQVRGVVKLNKSGVEIFNLLQKETTEDDIINTIANKYDNDRTTISKYVHSLIETLRKDGLIAD